MRDVLCVLCGERRARRGCPALGQQICSVCCGTKRVVEIDCPQSCAYLATAREHPAAAVLRQQQGDLTLLFNVIRDLGQTQSDLFSALTLLLQEYRPPALQPLIDDDVCDAVTSLAATFETASRGVIYEHRPASRPAAHLADAIKPILAAAGQGRGSAFERDAAVVLRKLTDVAADARRREPENRRAFLDLLNRVLRKTDRQAEKAGTAVREPSRLIVP